MLIEHNTVQFVLAVVLKMDSLMGALLSHFCHSPCQVLQLHNKRTWMLVQLGQIMCTCLVLFVRNVIVVSALCCS